MTERSTLDQLPDDLAALDDDALSELHDILVADFDREHGDPAPNVGALEALAADVTNVRSEADSRGLTLTAAAPPARPSTASTPSMSER